ncbi:MAG TPA: cytochrome c oxidase subunit 3 [Polyangiaceae bacterium]|nr:cytochrome c oxidase subunit 3 [Polyangiaceae bacterium]
MSEAGTSAAVLHGGDHGHHAGGGGGHGDHHGPIDYPKDEQFGLATPGKIAMWFFLCSDGFSFSGLLLTYGILRGASSVWHHPGEPTLGINFTAGLTFLLICSSVTMVLAHAAAVEGKQKELVRYLALTILGGALFLTGQYKEYFGLFGSPGLVEEGLVFGHSAYANTFYIVTSFHGCHVFAGVCYLSCILVGAMRGKYTNGNHSPVELVGLFWHFVDLVWILVFTFIYLIPE